jgi:hypothetical protein
MSDNGVALVRALTTCASVVCSLWYSSLTATMSGGGPGSSTPSGSDGDV